jgi:hypothetical protein
VTIDVDEFRRARIPGLASFFTHNNMVYVSTTVHTTTKSHIRNAKRFSRLQHIDEWDYIRTIDYVHSVQR